MHCHNCNSLMEEIDHDRSEGSERMVYECPDCGHQRLQLQPNFRHGPEPDRTYTTHTGSHSHRHSVWSARG